MLDGGADARPGRDRAGPAAGQGGASSAPSAPSPAAGEPDRPADRQRDRRDDRHDAARHRDRRGADRARAARHRPDRPQLRHRPGRDERAPALPVPARRRSAVACMPNAGLPQLTADGAHYPLTPERARRRARHVHPRVRARPRRRLLRHDAGAPAPGRRAGRAAASSPPRKPRREPGVVVALPARAVPPGHVVPLDRRADERQRQPGRSATRCSPRTGTTASRSPALRSATARTCSTSASTTSAGTASPTCATAAARLATSSTLPVDARLDRAGRRSRRAWSALAGRCVVNSVNYEDGDGPGSRFARIMPIVKEHGAAVVALTIDEEGQARTADWKVAGRLPADRRPRPAVGHASRATSSSTA